MTERTCSNCGAVLPAAKYMCAACGAGTCHETDGVQIQPGLILSAGGARHKPVKERKVEGPPPWPASKYRAIEDPHGE